MRLLHITHQYPPALGGSEKYIADLSEEMAKRGHSVDVFTAKSTDFHTWKNVLPAYELRNGVHVHRFWAMPRRGSSWRALHYGLRRYFETGARRYEPLIYFGGGPHCPNMFLKTILNANSYDIIHLNCLVYAQVAYGYWAASLRNAPIVVSPHLHAEQEVTYNIGYQRTVLTGSDHILADTDAEKEFLLNHDLNLSNEQISVIGAGVNPDLFPLQNKAEARRFLGLPEEDFLMLFFSRKSKYKGLDLTCRAFAQLQKEHENLVFVAAGTETEESQQMWPTYQGLPNLIQMEAVTEQEKIALLNACDCLVVPSVGEAFGIVYVEAWMMNKPVIGANITAVRKVIDHGENGFLIEPDNLDELTKYIEYFIEHPHKAAQMGQRGREKVLANFTTTIMGDRLESTYEQILEMKRKAHE